MRLKEKNNIFYLTKNINNLDSIMLNKIDDLICYINAYIKDNNLKKIENVKNIEALLINKLMKKSLDLIS